MSRLVLDPMLATGGSVELVIRRLQSWGVDEIRVLSIIASQTGVDRVGRDFPDVKVFVAAIDPVLNDAVIHRSRTWRCGRSHFRHASTRVAKGDATKIDLRFGAVCIHRSGLVDQP